jgi:hypothetical protein
MTVIVFINKIFKPTFILYRMLLELRVESKDIVFDVQVEKVYGEVNMIVRSEIKSMKTSISVKQIMTNNGVGI